MITTFQLLLPIIIPIAVALISHLIARLPVFGTPLAKVTCVIASFFTLYSVYSLIPTVALGPAHAQLLRVPSPTGEVTIGFYVDYLALLPALISTSVGTLALIYNAYYLSPHNKAYEIGWEFNRSYSFILIFIGAMVGSLFSSDLIGLLVFWELISLCSYALISFWQREQFCLKAAIKCLVITHIGSLSLLIAIIILYSTTRTLEILEISQTIPLGHPVIPAVLPFLLIAALPKTVQFPLHTWLPDGTVAPTSATVLFHVCGFQSGIYVIIRFFFHAFYPHVVSATKMATPLFFGNVSVWGFVISLIGALTLLIGALNGVLESDFKRIVAYSTISQLGYIVMAIGLTTPLGVVAGLFHLLSHALFCSLLFLCAGAVIYTTGKHSIDEMGGLYRGMPITTTYCTVGALALATMPLLSDFASKYLIFHATLEAGAVLFALVAFLGCALNMAIAVRLLHSVFMGGGDSGLDSSIRDPHLLMLLPMFLTSGALILFGVFPRIPLDSLIIPAVRQLGHQVNIIGEANWVSTPIGFWEPLTIAILALGLFAVMVAAMRYSSRITPTSEGDIHEEALQPFLCGEGVDLLGLVRAPHLYHALVKVMKVNDLCHSTNVDRFYYTLSRAFSDVCSRLIRFDVRQRYFPAVLSFIAGALVVLSIALLVV